MPELPEVERARRLIERVAVGRRITRVACADDRIVFDGVLPHAVEDALPGRRVVAAHRRGKHLVVELDEGPAALFHLGMTGHFRTRDERPIELASSAKRPDPSWPPRFTKIHLHLDDGGELVMTNARRLGRIRLRDDPWNHPPLSKLGFDPLLDMPPADEFARRLRRRTGVLKSLLLDQSFVAGVGNWVADEVLYQARIDPRRRAGELSESEARRVHRSLKRIIDTACAANAEKERLPRTWLFHRRWGKQKDARTERGERIEHVEIGGRTTAWVPSVQR